jgi:hypothetical protein
MDIKSIIEGALLAVKIFAPDKYEQARVAALAIQETYTIANEGNMIRLTADLTIMISNIKAGKEVLS